MEVRLNKLISDSGLCSRREADKFIEEGRVTVNGSLPQVGQKVTEGDIVMLDDIQVKIGKHTGKQTSSARINIQELELAGQEKKAKKTKLLSTTASEKKVASPTTGSKGLRPGKYVKYNKYAAARHAARNGESTKKRDKDDQHRQRDAKRSTAAQIRQIIRTVGRCTTLGFFPEISSVTQDKQEQPAQQGKACCCPQ